MHSLHQQVTGKETEIFSEQREHRSAGWHTEDSYADEKEVLVKETLVCPVAGDAAV